MRKATREVNACLGLRRQVIFPEVISAAQAAALIKDGDCVYFGGSGGGHGVAEDVIEALRDRFAAEQKPRGLVVAATVSIGDWKDTGFNHLSARGLVRARHQRRPEQLPQARISRIRR